MANPIWPVTLPVILYPAEQDSFLSEPETGVIRTHMDAGPVKARRRFTAIAIPTNLTIMMTQAQVATLKEFYRVTLASVLPFDWIDFITQASVTYRFVKSPTYTPVAANMWKVALTLEQMP